MNFLEFQSVGFAKIAEARYDSVNLTVNLNMYLMIRIICYFGHSLQVLLKGLLLYKLLDFEYQM